MLHLLRHFAQALVWVAGLLIGLAAQGFAQQPAQNIAPYSHLVLDTPLVYRYDWRCGNQDTCRSYSANPAFQYPRRLKFTSPEGEQISISRKVYVGFDLLRRPRVFAALPPCPLPPKVSDKAVQRMGYRKLAPLSSLADVQIGSRWLRNVLVFRPITKEARFMTPEGQLVRLSTDSISAWRPPTPDTNNVTVLKRNPTYQGRKSCSILRFYVEAAGGYGRNGLTAFNFGSLDYGWPEDKNLASLYFTPGINLWKSLSIGLRFGFDIPFGRGEYVPPPSQLTDRYQEVYRQEFTYSQLLTLRFLKLRKPVFYTTALSGGIAVSRRGFGLMLEWSNGISVRLVDHVILILDSFIAGAGNGSPRGFMAPGARVGVVTLLPF